MEYIVLGSGPGAILLAQTLAGEAHKPTDITLRGLKALYRDPEACLINWGWSTAWANLNKMGRKERWVKNKVDASKLMELCNINCAVYMSWEDAESFLINHIDEHLLQRNEVHSKGRDIVKIGINTNMRTDKWFVKIFPKDREYRVHVLHGQVIKLQRKIPEDPAELVWNSDHAEFRRVRLTNPSYDGINALAVRAVVTLGLDFGAVDIGTQGWNKGAGPTEIIVFEVNTAPALNENTAAAYAQGIRERYE